MDPEEKNNYKFIYTRNTAFHLRFVGLFVILIMFAAVPLFVLLINNRTQSRSKAAASTTITLSSATTSATVGENIPVAVALNPGTNAVSVVNLVITYDKTQLAPSGSFALNTTAFPVTLNSIVYNNCVTGSNLCHITVDVSTGSDPTKVITTNTTVGTMAFTALAPTTQATITIDSSTQVFEANATTNVLSTTIPVALVIANHCDSDHDSGCPSPTPTPTFHPTSFPSSTPTTPPSYSPTPTPTCIPRPACLDATPACQIAVPANGWCPVITPTCVLTPPTCVTGEACPNYILCQQLSSTPTTIPVTLTQTVTPTINQTNAYASISLLSPAIGKNGGNLQPQHPTRSVTVTLYNIATQQQYTSVDTVSFDGVSSFKNTQFNLGTIPAGTYQILVNLPGDLQKLLTQTNNSNTFSIVPGNTVVIPPASLIAGDIAPIPGTDNQPYGDNVLDISDYNVLIGCYSDTAPAKACTPIGKLAADLNDDGFVNAIDYNILLRSFAIRQGDTTPPTNTPTPTQSVVTPTIFLTTTPTPTTLPPTPTSAGVSTVMITMTQFTPQTITIAAGTTVNWTNSDTMTHTTTSDDQTMSEAWDSGTLQPGQSFTKTFTTAGTYTYHCNIHPTMTGSVVVQ